MNRISVKMIADSISDEGIRLSTFHARYPRIIHSEVMTHRVFSRNARSSRAVPVQTMLNEIKTEPFIPWHWGKNQKGMQASEECNEEVCIRDAEFYDEGMDRYHGLSRDDAWLWARDKAVGAAEAYMKAGYHKQIANRLLEPFMYIDTLISTTSFENFYVLRDHEDAEPHFHDLASAIRTVVKESEPKYLPYDQWHMPFIDMERDHDPVYKWVFDTKYVGSVDDIFLRLSVARCARISYAPFDGNGSVEKELERYDLLVGSDPIHASPSEHQAKPDYFDGMVWDNPSLHGNFTGYIQYRKTIPYEYHRDYDNHYYINY